jgi:hypothetical protein
MRYRAVFVFACIATCVACSDDDGAAADGGGAGKGGKDSVGGTSGKGSVAGKGPVAGKGSSGRDLGSGGEGPVAGDPDSGPHAGASGSRGTPVDGGFCCKPSPRPGCCINYGGFATSLDQCTDACDGMPIPDEAWTLVTDEHGCKKWVEPREWTNCCGCEDNPRGICDASGTWRIDYPTYDACGPSDETITLSVDEDGGAAEVTFESRGLRGWQCGSANDDLSMYEATAVASANGCVVTLSSHSKWCTSGEAQCENLDVKLYLQAFKAGAEVEGTFRKCWCQTSGPEGKTVQVNGVATRM